jgi:iron complex outermembrane receptor protein
VDDAFFKDVRMGIKASTHENALTVTGSKVFYTSPVSLSDFTTHLTPSGLFSGLNDNGNSNQFATLTEQGVIDALNAGLYVDTGIDKSSTFSVREKVANAYVQLDFGSGPIHGSGGYRMVYTSDKSSYYAHDRRRQHLYPDRVAQGLSEVPAQPERFVGHHRHLQAARRRAEVIARPRYAQLAGAFSRNDTNLTASTGNPISIPTSRPTMNCRANGISAPVRCCRWNTSVARSAPTWSPRPCRNSDPLAAPPAGIPGHRR